MPDFGKTSDDELRNEIRKLEQEARRISYERRIVHGRIATLEAELEVREAVRRLDGA